VPEQAAVVSDVRCAVCDTLKLSGAVGWVEATDGSGGECCPRCYKATVEKLRPIRVPPLPTDPGGANTRENKLAIGRGERWKADHEAGECPRWPGRFPFRRDL
jgi:hypothetical protein